MLKEKTATSSTIIPLKGLVSVHERFIYQSVARAMQGNIMMALIELITNSNDSYQRLGQKDRKIIVSYRKDGFKGIFSVIDNAEGQNLEDFGNNFTKYWKPSDITEENSQRGYFGKGAKDALGYMDSGQIASFKDGYFILCTIFFDEEHIMKYEVLKHCKATAELRKKYGIENNGTVASFIADPKSDKKIKVPQFNTLYEDLSNHYLLRKILKDDDTKVILVNAKGGKKEKRRLLYVDPKGDKIHEEDFDINYGDYDPFSIHMEVSRSETILSQKDKGETREGGLLIVDEKGVVLDISLFKYDYDLLASKFFGEVVINGFRKLLKNNEIVLSPERDGLIQNHPFVETLVKEINKRLDVLVQRERERLQRFDVTTVGREHQKRQQEFCKLLNEIAAEELKYKVDEPLNEIPYPINGFSISPESVQVAANSHTVYRLIIDTKKVSSGTWIELESTNPSIKFENKDNRILVPAFKNNGKKSEKGHLVVTHITVAGSKPRESAKIIAKAPDRTATASIYITPPEDINKDGLSFQFPNITVAPNQTRKIILLASNKRMKTGDEINIESDNKHIHVEPEKIIVNEVVDNLKYGILKYEIDIWGAGEGQEGTIYASCDPFKGKKCEALMGVEIKFKEDKDKKLKGSIFSPPEYRSDPEPPQPASYSNEMEKVFIYTKFPTVSYYLGDDLETMYSLPAQLYISNLVMEKYFYQLAFKAVDNSGTILSERNKADAIQGRKNELMKKYGTKLLNVLVDQRMLKKSFKEKSGE